MGEVEASDFWFKTIESMDFRREALRPAPPEEGMASAGSRRTVFEETVGVWGGLGVGCG